MSDKEARLFEVQHPERPAVQVQAVDRLRAVAAAAREWGRPVDGDRQRL